MEALARFFMRMSMMLSAKTGHPHYAISRRWRFIMTAEIDRVFEPAEDKANDQ